MLDFSPKSLIAEKRLKCLKFVHYFYMCYKLLYYRAFTSLMRIYGIIFNCLVPSNGLKFFKCSNCLPFYPLIKVSTTSLIFKIGSCYSDFTTPTVFCQLSSIFSVKNRQLVSQKWLKWPKMGKKGPKNQTLHKGPKMAYKGRKGKDE